MGLVLQTLRKDVNNRIMLLLLLYWVSALLGFGAYSYVFTNGFMLRIINYTRRKNGDQKGAETHKRAKPKEEGLEPARRLKKTKKCQRARRIPPEVTKRRK